MVLSHYHQHEDNAIASWELKLEWDEVAPQEIHDAWFKWRSE